MRPILTVAEMRAAEAAAIACGVSIATLMRRSGAAVAEAAARFAGPIETLILCGPGNNGGDGYVAARVLRERGVAVRVAAGAAPRSDAARAAAAAWGDTIEGFAEARPAPLVIDAVVGTGLTQPLAEDVQAALVRLGAAARLRIAVDVPSGVESDRGTLLGTVPRYDLTVALGALKPAHRLLPAADRCGRVVVADIGVPLGGPSGLVEIGRPRLAPPPVDANKYSRGKLLVIGGAMPGAGLLAAMSAQRAGAGYVELAGVDGGIGPHALVQRAWDRRALADERIAALLIGPGLGRDATARARLDAALEVGKPMVIDADALTLIGRARHARLAGHIVTPHWGEFVRLFGDDGADRLTQARAAAAGSGAIVVLKGGDTIVAHPDGRTGINPPASSWLSTAGTGDVLAGVIAGRLATGEAAFDAATTGVWLASAAARRAGPMLIADDLVAHLPHAVAACL